MGMFLDDTAMLVIVAPLYVPLVIALGFDPIWYGVLYTITCQIAYITPPFGYNLFLMRAMAPPEITLPDIYRSIIPFVLIMLVALGDHHRVPADRALAAAALPPEITTGRRTMTNRRSFLKRAGLAGAGAVGATTLAAPYVKAQEPIKWRMQTYAGAPLGAFVIKPSIDAFNAAANGEMDDRALLLRPAGAAGRAVPRRAAGHARRGAVRRRLDRLAGRRGAVRRLLPVRHPLLARRAGALRRLRPERDLGGVLRRTPA